MFLKTKKRIFELLDSVSEYLGIFTQLSDPVSAIRDCLQAIKAIENQLNEEENFPKITYEQLKKVEETFNDFLNDSNLLNDKLVKNLSEQVYLLRTTFEIEVEAKLNVVFFPYKASMWDSLATVYETAVKDDNCKVNVVPIPYYQLSQNGEIPTYEGNHFPENVSITHYSQYDLESEQPDIIFVHNIYDDNNTLTRVYEQYFTSNLRKYTDMLVFVPYHISSFIPPQDGNGFLAYRTPSVQYVDKIILVNDYLKEAAIRDGIPEEKLLVLGSPKLDEMVRVLKEGISYPKEWNEKIEGKKVYVINTGCLYFANEPFIALERLLDFFSIRRIVEDSVIIWRPHPLTKTSIMRYTPHFLNYYLNLTEKYIKGEDELYSGLILDETADYFPALCVADVLISSDSSILRSYLLTEKKVLFWDEKLPENALIPSNVFYYAFNKVEPWYELVKKFSKGYDPLAENRKGMAAKVYANIDGTSGEKVYQAIKECVLQND